MASAADRRRPAGDGSKPSGPMSVLTDQEWRVASLVGGGSTNKAVARELSISIKTVEFHLGNIYRKLVIQSRTELAHAIGLLQAQPDPPAAAFGNLRPEREVLVGRAALHESIVEELKGHRLLTLSGVGGVGKTSLAVAVAHQVAADFRDGAWMVELAALRAGSDVATAAAIALGLTERRSSPTVRDVARGMVRQQRLVILDNCEHVLDDAARLAAAITDSCADVTVLATSRERLDLAGEHVIAVPPLDVDVADDVSPAVALFVERARSAFDAFSPSSEEWPILDRICRRLDGLPLAIELAAARVGGLGVAEIDDRLDDRFALLTRRRQLAGTHSSLYRTIEWSYALLADAERSVFESLSVFVGDFDLRAGVAVAVGGGHSSDAAADIASLVDKSMIVSVQSDTGRRYRFLDTLRDFAFARLAGRSGVAAALRSHLDHYCSLAHEVDVELRGPSELHAHRALLADWHNIRTAMSTACAADDASSACALLDSVYLWARTRLRNEVGEWAERIRRLPSARDHPARPIATAVAAACAWYRGQPDLARELLAAARSEEERLGMLATPLVPVVGVDIDDYPQHWEDTQETQRRAHANGDPFWELFGLLQETIMRGFHVAFHDVPADEREQHLNRIRHGIEVAERSQSPQGVAVSVMTLGIALQFSDPDQAINLLERSLAIGEPLGIELLEGLARQALASALTTRGRPLDALRIMADSLRAHDRSGTTFEIADDLAHCVAPLEALGDDELAIDIADVIRRTAHATNSPIPIVLTTSATSAHHDAPHVVLRQHNAIATLDDAAAALLATVTRHQARLASEAGTATSR